MSKKKKPEVLPEISADFKNKVKEYFIDYPSGSSDIFFDEALAR